MKLRSQINLIPLKLYNAGLGDQISRTISRNKKSSVPGIFLEFISWTRRDFFGLLCSALTHLSRTKFFCYHGMQLPIISENHGP